MQHSQHKPEDRSVDFSCIMIQQWQLEGEQTGTDIRAAAQYSTTTSHPAASVLMSHIQYYLPAYLHLPAPFSPCEILMKMADESEYFLVPLDANCIERIPVPHGETTLGRGPFLKVRTMRSGCSRSATLLVERHIAMSIFGFFQILLGVDC